MKPRIKTNDVRLWQDSRRYGYCLVALAMFIPPIITIAVWGAAAWIHDRWLELWADDSAYADSLPRPWKLYDEAFIKGKR